MSRVVPFTFDFNVHDFEHTLELRRWMGRAQCRPANIRPYSDCSEDLAVSTPRGRLPLAGCGQSSQTIAFDPYWTIESRGAPAGYLQLAAFRFQLRCSGSAYSVLAALDSAHQRRNIGVAFGEELRIAAAEYVPLVHLRVVELPLEGVRLPNAGGGFELHRKKFVQTMTQDL